MLPRDDVMGVTVSGWPVAAREHTALVPGMQRLPNRGRDEPVFLADIEHPGRPAEHHRQDVCVAGVLAQFAGGQRCAFQQSFTRFS